MKLFQILQLLDTRERKRFGYYLGSPLFNRREDIKRLYASWQQRSGASAPADVCWSAVYPERTFDRKSWNLLTSRTFKLLEEFLVLERMRSATTGTAFQLAKAYRSLRQEQRFEEAVRAAEKALNRQPLRTLDYLQNRHALASERYDYILSGNRRDKPNLQEVSDALDVYFLAAKLRQTCNARSREIISTERYTLGFLPEVLAYVTAHPAVLEVPAVAVYYYCYQALDAGETADDFRRFREVLTRYRENFPPHEIRDLYTFVINVYIRKLNAGAKRYAEEALALYRLSLEQGYLLEDGVLLASTYVNIVVLAAVLKDYDWAVHFVETHRVHLKAEFRVPLYHFALGKIFYERGKREDSLRQLVLVDTKASFIFLGARVLQLKIYYELGEIGPLESLLESLRVYLQRSKDLAYRKAHYHNILVFTRGLLQLPAMDRAARTAFRERIEAAEIFGEKEWFLKQIG